MAEIIYTLQHGEIIVNGYATADITAEQMARWANSLTYVSGYAYGFTMDGELIPIDDEALIQSAFNTGVAPLMVVAPFNEYGEYSYELVNKVHADPRMRDRLINNIVETVRAKRYYGVVYDFGYISEENASEFVITVSKTAARLNRIGALMIVSLTPGFNDTGLDYESLSRAANFLELKAFHWEQMNEPPSAISPITKVKQMLFLISGLVDPRMILLGLTNYGLDWKTPFSENSPAEMVPHIEAENRAASVGAELQYDVELESPYYTYTNETGSSHEVWYEDARSTRVKLELVGEYGLAGVSIWTIMNPFPTATQTIQELYTVKKVL